MGIHHLALLVAELAVGLDEGLVEVVAGRERTKVALAGFEQVGLGVQGHDDLLQALQVARATAARTRAGSRARQRAVTCWSGRTR